MIETIRNMIKISLLEYVSRGEVADVKRYADNLFSDINLEIDFSDHFMDRINDPRNEPDIEPIELKQLYARAKQKYGSKIANMQAGKEAVISDKVTDINVPFVMDKGKDGKDMVNKTVMRKKHFLSTSPILKV